MTRGPAIPTPRFGGEGTELEVNLRRALYGNPHDSDPVAVPHPPRTDARIEHLRVPPQSVEAEQSVLGAVMIFNAAFANVRAALSAEDFYLRRHQLIFRAMCELDEKDSPMDAVTVGEWFDSKGLSEEVAGGSYLIELATTTPSAANVDAYAGIVRDRAVLRQLIEAGTTIVNNGFNPDGRDSSTLVAEAITTTEKCLRSKDSDYVDGAGLMTGMYQKMIHRYEHGVTLMGIPTPYPQLTEMLNGLQPKRVYGVMGRTKMGKSIMLLDIAGHVSCVEGKSIGVWSIEMGEEEVAMRLAANRARIQIKKIEHPGLMSDDDWMLLKHGMQEVKGAQITAFFDPIVRVEKIAAQAAMLKAKGRLDAMFVDYLQIVESSGKERRDLDIGHVSWTLKQTAKRLDVPVVVGVQVNRGSEKSGQTPRPPRASDARESGNIEQDLDALIGIHRPGYYDKRTRGTRTEVITNRSGETGVFKLDEDLAIGIFHDRGDPWFDGAQESDEKGGFD